MRDTQQLRMREVIGGTAEGAANGAGAGQSGSLIVAPIIMVWPPCRRCSRAIRQRRQRCG